ncbi:hypothetical protein BT69DRAFT_1284198 [Atractiella rhizophila]|nr:hypothetical protein BT69DRAFT_1284198 [Atractiella rhizophila]
MDKILRTKCKVKLRNGVNERKGRQGDLQPAQISDVVTPSMQKVLRCTEATVTKKQVIKSMKYGRSGMAFVI